MYIRIIPCNYKKRLVNIVIDIMYIDKEKVHGVLTLSPSAITHCVTVFEQVSLGFHTKGDAR
jgi:hypothetical protein